MNIVPYFLIQKYVLWISKCLHTAIYLIYTYQLLRQANLCLHTAIYLIYTYQLLRRANLCSRLVIVVAGFLLLVSMLLRLVNKKILFRGLIFT